MTDSVVIPQLHLFSSHRHHRSPTKDFVDQQYYKTSRRTIESCHNTCARRPIFTQPPIHIPVPYPVEVPVPVPVQPYPVLIPAPIPELNAQFIRAPTTYVDYAQQFLMGRPAPILPSLQTARFIHSTSRSRVERPARCDCQLDCHKPKESFTKYEEKKPEPPKPKVIVTPPPAIKKDPYFDIETERQRKRMEEEQKRRQAELNKKQEEEEQRRRQEEIEGIFRGVLSHGLQLHEEKTFRDLFQYANELSRQKKMEEEEREKLLRAMLEHAQEMCRQNERELFLQKLLQFAEERRKEKMEREQLEKELKMILKFAEQKYRENKRQIAILRQMVKMGKEKQQQQMGKSVLIEKFMRTIPTTLDSNSLREIIKTKVQHFNSIKVDFDDLPLISVDDLVEMKDQYMENSRNILLRLNDLAGDRAEVSLMYKLLKTQTKREMVWPDL